MYGHALALLPKCTTHPEQRAIEIDDTNPTRLLCAPCAWAHHTKETTHVHAH